MDVRMATICPFRRPDVCQIFSQIVVALRDVEIEQVLVGLGTVDFQVEDGTGSTRCDSMSDLFRRRDQQRGVGTHS